MRNVLAHVCKSRRRVVLCFHRHGLRRGNTPGRKRAMARRRRPDDDSMFALLARSCSNRTKNWAVQRARYMTIISQMSDDSLISLPAVAR